MKDCLAFWKTLKKYQNFFYLTKCSVLKVKKNFGVKRKNQQKLYTIKKKNNENRNKTSS